MRARRAALLAADKAQREAEWSAALVSEANALRCGRPVCKNEGLKCQFSCWSVYVLPCKPLDN